MKDLTSVNIILQSLSKCLISIWKALSLTREQVLDQRKCQNEECSKISDVRVSENKTDIFCSYDAHIVENKIVIGLTQVWYYHAAPTQVIATPIATP